jgi:hypothetical protein
MHHRDNILDNVDIITKPGSTSLKTERIKSKIPKRLETKLLRGVFTNSKGCQPTPFNEDAALLRLMAAIDGTWKLYFCLWKM